MELPSPSPWLAIIVTFITMALIYAIKPSRRGRLPPGPRPFPVVGNMLVLGEQPHRSLARLAKTHGSVMSLKLGRVTTIVVSSTDAARQVLQVNNQALCGRPPPDAIRALRHHESSVAWLPTNQLWRNHRRICNTKLFLSSRLDNGTHLRHLKIRELVGFLGSSVGEPVDIGQAAFGTMMDSISNTLFSIDVADLNAGSVRSIKDVMRAIMEEVGRPNISDFFPVLASLDLQGRRARTTAQFKMLHDIFDQLLDQRIEARGERTSSTVASDDFLNSLVECHLRDDDHRLDRDAIKSLLTDLFVAGTDTSSTTVEWAMAELLRNPGAMSRARDELAVAIGVEAEVKESDIQRLPYLQAVVKETLRLHPSLPFLLPHCAERAVELCGYTVPEGTRVLVNAWAIGRDEDVWEDAERFAPERFLASEISYKGRDFELIPFGAGRRICPGLPLASRMVHLMLASMIHSFDWKLPEGMEHGDVDMGERFGLSLAKAAPLLAIPINVEKQCFLQENRYD